MVHLETKIILLGLKKAFDVTQNFNYSMTFIEGPSVHKVTTISVRW